MSILDNVFGFFVDEANDHLRILEDGLLRLEKDPAAAAELIEPLFRAAHTLKGSANLMTITDVGAVAHRVEDLFEEIRDTGTALSSQQVDALLFVLDQMREMIEFRKAGKVAPEDLVTVSLGRLADADRSADSAEAGVSAADSLPDDLPKGEETDSSVGKRERRDHGRKLDEAGTVRVGLEKIESLMGLVGEFTVTKNHLIDRLPVMNQMRSEVDFAGQRLLREVSGFADKYDYTLPKPSSSAGDDAFNELEFDRYDELNLFSRKLREVTSDIDEALKEMSGFFKSFTRDVQSLDRMTEAMKEQISAARTVPAEQLFQRFSRTVRGMSQKLGKPVELSISGGETLIDRVIYDGLFDPLLHIVRNVFAHAIEPASRRQELGKSPTARIALSAVRLGNTVEISVEDDGCGINLDQVFARAVEKGFVAAAAQLTEQQLIQLIFRPGFSTTVAADSESGRGVGMSVVMDSLGSLNGTIEVETETGKGTRFRLRLPLSLVIVNVIQFSCGGQKFVIPSALVEEIVDLNYASRKADSSAAKEVVASIPLASLLQLPGSQSPPAFGVVTQSEGAPVMLLVDAILGQEDTVLKPFGSFLEGLPWFSGSSLSGDGTLRLVINPARMKRFSEQEKVTASFQVPTAAVDDVVAKVLVVDDSLSVRKYASLLLEAHGFAVITAVNGEDALARLKEEKIFSIITDLEMPVMHGYDLLRALKAGGFEKIPVAVLTSRAGEQHRQEALALGATDYLVKPFDEEGLLAIVTQHQKM